MLCSSCCVYNVFKFQFMSCFVSYVGIMRPVLAVRGTLRLVLPVVNEFFDDFYSFCWGLLVFYLCLVALRGGGT